MIDFLVVIKTIFLFGGLIILAPLFLSVSQSINILVKTHHFQLRIKDHYRMAIKALLLGFSRKEDIWSFVFLWFELVVIGSILSMIQFTEDIFWGANLISSSIIETKNSLLIVTILIIVLNILPFLKFFLIRMDDESFVLNRLSVRLGSIIFLALANYISLLITYKTSYISYMIQTQTGTFAIGIPKLGIFLNPLNALVFLVLIILSVNYLMSEQKRYIHELSGQIFIEKCIWVLKLVCLSILFSCLFLGGFKEFGFFGMIVDEYPKLQIPIQAILWLIKTFIVFSFFSFVNYFLISMTGRIMGETMVFWFIPIGFSSILYSWIWSIYFA